MQSVVSILKKEGGFSFSKEGKAPNSGYMVSLPDDEKIVNFMDVKSVQRAYKENLQSLKKGQFVGGWYNSKNNKVYIDKSINVKTKKKAIELGKKYNQISIYHVDSGNVINLK